MINQAILNRRSVRHYTEEVVSDEMIVEIIKAAQFAPTAMNNRSWEFIVIKDKQAKKKLCDLTSSLFRQEGVQEASVVIIPVINNIKSGSVIADLSAAVENIFIQVAELGLGAFWKNVPAQEEITIKEAFNIPDDFSLICIIPIGYPAGQVVPHDESEFDELKIHWERW